MKCPWKLNVPGEFRTDDECDLDCAWLVVDSPNEYTGHGRPVLRCAVAVLAASSDSLVSSANCVEEGE